MTSPKANLGVSIITGIQLESACISVLDRISAHTYSRTSGGVFRKLTAFAALQQRTFRLLHYNLVPKDCRHFRDLVRHERFQVFQKSVVSPTDFSGFHMVFRRPQDQSMRRTAAAASVGQGMGNSLTTTATKILYLLKVSHLHEISW